MSEPLRQLNMADPRVAAWYDAVALHGERDCTSDDTCRGCRLLRARRDKLRAIPGLLIEVPAWPPPHRQRGWSVTAISLP